MNGLIGLLDSGVGGLTTLNQIIISLPEENTVHFGDMGRAPYGSRSPEVINRYSEQIVGYLTDNYDLKLIVTACHTVSATSLDHLRKISPVPIVGMIESVPEKALGATKAGRIGVIGTKSTIQDYLGEDVVIIDPSVECFEHIKDYLTAEGKLNRNNYSERIYLVTDNPERFRSSGERHLDRKIHQVSLVDIGDLERKV